MSGLVILSGGLDSTVCMALAARDTDGVLALTFDYGQRHRIELDRAALVAAHYGAEHLVVVLDASQWGGSALTDPMIAVPDAQPGDAGDAIPVTYVPARNLVFLPVAMGVSEARRAGVATRARYGGGGSPRRGRPIPRCPDDARRLRALRADAAGRGPVGRPAGGIRAPGALLAQLLVVRHALLVGLEALRPRGG